MQQISSMLIKLILFDSNSNDIIKQSSQLFNDQKIVSRKMLSPKYCLNIILWIIWFVIGHCKYKGIS